MNGLRKYGLAPRGDTNALGSEIVPSFGDMLVECVDDHNNEVWEHVDWSMWAVSGDNDDDNPPVTGGSLSPDLDKEWQNWCAEDPDWESGVTVEDGRMSE